MKSVGIIGVGEIGRAIVIGLCEDDGPAPRVNLSPRGTATVTELSRRYDNVRVCADNQSVADDSDLLILAVRRRQRHEALAGLRLDDDKPVVNVMAGVANDDLRRILATDAPLVRAIPLPAVRDRGAVTVTWPSHHDVDDLFRRLGGVLAAADEADFDVYSALTGTLTSHYEYLATLTAWAVANGIEPGDADRYLRGLFQGVGRALSDESRSLGRLAADHETPGGNNERVRTTWFDQPNADALHRALDGLLTDLRRTAADD